MLRLATLIPVSLLLASCAWVKMEPGAQAVRVARPDADLSQCQRAGEIAVSVRDRVGFYERDDLKVREELETLARNEADALRADTLQAQGPPIAGEQRFAGYRCGVAVEAAPARPSRAPAGPVTDERSIPPVVETAPVEADSTQGFQPIDDGG